MKLTKFRVTNFRSIEDSGDIELSQTLCLVGKNEAGKSAILQALAGLSPHPSTPSAYDIERDYPRRYLPEYDERHAEKGAIVITTQWQPDENEKKAISEAFGEKALDDAPVVVQRRYEADPEWIVPINYSEVIRHLLDDEHLSVAERKPFAACSNTDELRKALEQIETRTEKQVRLLDRMNKLIGKNASSAISAILQAGLPRFMLFSHYDRMAGQLRLDTYAARKAGSQPPPIAQGETVFIDFLEYAGTSVEEIMEATTYEGLNARCEGASNRITQQLLEYWTQNPNLEIEVRVTKGEPDDEPPFNSGVIARARVRNNLHKVTVPFSERSAGFIWFFSFLVKFAQVRKSGGALILLLDEPGLTLHGKAQGDLLRYFADKISPSHQLIYTTHSPFMVPADRLPEVRIVEDKITSPKPGVWVSEGTKVRDDALAVDRDTLFPLQGALGYEVTQTLFIGKHVLLVEGPGDILYLQAWSSALAARKRAKLDPRLTICPAGGIDKIQPFVSLFSGAKLDIAALSDYAKADKKKLETMRQNRVLESSRLLTFATLLGVEEADSEDVFTTELFADVVNQAFSLPAKHRLTAAAIEGVTLETTRLVKRVEALFKLLPPDFPEFDHYTPAAWLLRNPKALDGDTAAVKTTLDRAENVIKAINQILD